MITECKIMIDQEKVLIYLADVSILDDAEIFRHFYRQTSLKRQQKIDSFLFQKDKNLSLGVAILLKIALNNIGIFHYEVKRGEFGKPYLKNNSNVFFNLSHSKKMAMCVIAKDEVGCDIEKIDGMILDGMILNKSEHTGAIKSCIKSCNAKKTKSTTPDISKLVLAEGEKREDFFKIWTAKESYLKMTGVGMGKDLRSFKIQLPLGRQTIDNKDVRFFDVLADEKYQAAVCANGRFNKNDIEIKNIDLKQIWQL